MAQTLAELLIRIKTEGSQAVKRELRDIEDAMRKANAASERNIKAFERTQSRIIAGQKKMMTSAGGGGGASSLGIDPKALDGVTKALKDMAGPLNAVLDGFTQIAQVLATGSFRKQLKLAEISDVIKYQGKQMKDATKALKGSRFNEVRGLADAYPTGAFFEKDRMGKLVEKAAGAFQAMFMSTGASMADYARLMDRVAEYNDLIETQALHTGELSDALVKQKRLQEETLPLWERISGQFQQMPMWVKATTVGFTALAFFVASAAKSMYQFLLNSRQASREYEDMQSRLQAFHLKGRNISDPGVMRGVNADITQARAIAGPSRYTTTEIANMMTNLRAFGLNARRIAPTMAKVGQAYGFGGPELNELTRGIYGRLAAGEMPENETLARIGITKAMLKQQGVKFDKNQLLSDTNTVMSAIEKIANQKFGRIFELTKNNATSMAASIEDAMNLIQQKMGGVTDRGLTPFYDALKKALDLISNGGFAEALAKDLIAPLNDLGKSLKEFQGTLIVTLSIVGAAMATMAHSAGRVPRALSNIFGKDRSWKDRASGLFELSMVATRTTGGADLQFALEKQQQYLKLLNAGKGSAALKIAEDKGGFGGPPAEKPEDKDKKDKAKRTLEKIENNTRKSAELLDLRRQTIGGGEIAALGITGAEIAGMGLKNRSEISLRSPIRPDTQVIRGIKDLVYGNMNFALQGSPINRVRF